METFYVTITVPQKLAEYSVIIPLQELFPERLNLIEWPEDDLLADVKPDLADLPSPMEQTNDDIKKESTGKLKDLKVSSSKKKKVPFKKKVGNKIKRVSSLRLYEKDPNEPNISRADRRRILSAIRLRERRILEAREKEKIAQDNADLTAKLMQLQPIVREVGTDTSDFDENSHSTIYQKDLHTAWNSPVNKYSLESLMITEGLDPSFLDHFDVNI